MTSQPQQPTPQTSFQRWVIYMLTALDAKMGAIMTEQADIDAATAAIAAETTAVTQAVSEIQTFDTNLATAQTNIETEIAALKGAGVDTTALDQAVAGIPTGLGDSITSLTTAVEGITSIAPPASS